MTNNMIIKYFVGFGVLIFILLLWFYLGSNYKSSDSFDLKRQVNKVDNGIGNEIKDHELSESEKKETSKADNRVAIVPTHQDQKDGGEIQDFELNTKSPSQSDLSNVLVEDEIEDIRSQILDILYYDEALSGFSVEIENNGCSEGVCQLSSRIYAEEYGAKIDNAGKAFYALNNINSYLKGRSKDNRQLLLEIKNVKIIDQKIVSNFQVRIADSRPVVLVSPEQALEALEASKILNVDSKLDN